MRRRKLFFGIFLVCAFLIAHQNCQENSINGKSGRSHSLKASALNAGESLPIAQLIYQRITGTKLPKDHSTILQMIGLLDIGEVDQAIAVALSDDDFLNITIRDFASEMSNREETPVVPLNDFTATMIGIVKDDLNAQTMLTGNFFYRATADTNVAGNLLDDIVSSNNHYVALDDANANLAKVLERQEGQQIKKENQLEDLTDAAGVITSRAFMKAHASDGTNRRLVQFVFREFLCKPISLWASTAYPDNRVGRDIGRSPITEYRNKCVACHAPMDAMRPAFAYFDFVKESDTVGHIGYRTSISFDPNEQDASVFDVPVAADEQFVPSKFRRGKSVYPEGFKVKSDHWQNYTFANSDFGWRIRPSGSGLSQFAEMLAHSRAFSECMSRRVFRSVCIREIEDDEKSMLSTLANDFETAQYSFKALYSAVVKRPECLGLEL